MRIAPAIVAVLVTLPIAPVVAQSSDHEGAPLADAIAAQSCTLKEAETPALLRDNDIAPSAFPQMMFALMSSGHLVGEADGVFRLKGWGDCPAS